jgi:hypothetical protein
VFAVRLGHSFTFSRTARTEEITEIYDNNTPKSIASYLVLLYSVVEVRSNKIHSFFGRSSPFAARFGRKRILLDLIFVIDGPKYERNG